jgi:NAD(P)-dependent dehydrogenase (short-subunit alcohol dehydrogenase family)
MADLILTGASRGIGHALALALAERREDRLVLVARDRARLEALVTAVEQKGGRGLAVSGDLSSLAGARALGQRLVEVVTPGATLIHNAARLARLLARERWSPPGHARWLVEEAEQPWPAVAESEATRRAVRDTTERLLASSAS